MAKRRKQRRTRRTKAKPEQLLLSATFKTGGEYAEPKTMNLRTGEIGRDYRVRPRRSKGSAVNPKMPEPASPGRWVDTDDCQLCGEKYKRWRSGVSWDQASQMLYDGPQGGDTGKATTGKFYRSRGAILWRMHVLKMGEWYARHSLCGPLADELAPVKLPKKLFHQVAHGRGCLNDDDLAELSPRQRRAVKTTAGWICGGPARPPRWDPEPPPGMDAETWAELVAEWEADEAEALAAEEADQVEYIPDPEFGF